MHGNRAACQCPFCLYTALSDLSCCCELLRRTGTCSLAMRYGLVCWEFKSVPAGRSGSQRPPCASAAGPQARLCAAPQPPGPPPDPGTPPASMRRASFCTCSQPSAQAVAHLFCRCKAHRLVAAAQPFNDTARLRGGRCDAEGSMGMKQNKKRQDGGLASSRAPPNTSAAGPRSSSRRSLPVHHAVVTILCAYSPQYRLPMLVLPPAAASLRMASCGVRKKLAVSDQRFVSYGFACASRPHSEHSCVRSSNSPSRRLRVAQGIVLLRVASAGEPVRPVTVGPAGLPVCACAIPHSKQSQVAYLSVCIRI